MSALRLIQGEGATWPARLGDRRVIASISGGKDSAALSLWLTEQGIEVGCWPCIYARKAEIRMLGEDDERVGLIRELEEELTERARARAAAKGEELKWERTWFQQGSGRALDELWPIDKAIAWSRTARGGRQFDMFATAPRDAGCMRWGLCETDTKEGA